MDYRNNADYYCNQYGTGALSYNQVLDCYFIEGSLEPTEPVTLAEAKNFCKIDVDDDDVLLQALITAARQLCEAYSNIGFINRQVAVVLNNGNGGAYLPFGPIYEIISVTDTYGNVVTADIQGVKWKQVLWPRAERLDIVYNAGYETLPEDLKTALLNAIYYLYDNRSVATDGIGEIAKKILNPISRNG